MSTFLQVIVNGLGQGAVFALLALGFVIIYKATETINFAHGSLVLIGGYVAFAVKPHLGWLVAALVGVLVAAIAGLLIERVLLAHSRNASPDSLAILTIGVDVIILTEVTRRLGTAAAPFLGDPYDNKAMQLLGLTVSRTYVVALVVAAILIGLFFLAFRYTSWGLEMRAQSENREASALMGIRSWRVTASAWAVGGALAGIAVLFLATNDIGGGSGLLSSHTVAFAAFPAAIIGGLTSPGGSVVGGLVVGLANAIAAQYVSLDFANVAVYLVMLVVLLARPAGLFGKVEQLRV
ncbi:branched-chain amino acid ABC transporter permease [Calidifontibacter sp. DB0510]|uniref:Branched-chain amino acid ABC transporter permease n=1 Tax=Metallococcus carri TaxID=1656884 RepID=A0A967B7B7_9MICO|nr:branched-chain amino acid ABC transporter permease [Metallococcus carri]NHN56907.1 branched-chain amino acid ABC transporter permease [Metallococcus carri]NOP37652.1 branched-chain amino acid ABC transporter permease [Calidifontibacter sp. DB2511S]